jgi:hypothetical protein
MRFLRTITSAVAPRAASAAQASSGDGWFPPTGLQVSRQVSSVPVPSSYTILRSAAAVGNGLAVVVTLDDEARGSGLALGTALVDEEALPEGPGLGDGPPDGVVEVCWQAEDNASMATRTSWEPTTPAGLVTVPF